VPLNDPVIGSIGRSQEPLVTDALSLHSRIPNQEFIPISDFKSYAGCPLKFGEEILGVVAMFSQHEFAEEVIQHLSGFSNQAAIALKNASLFNEINKLKNQLQVENQYLQEEIKNHYHGDMVLGKSAPFKQMMRKVEQVAPTDATVLVLGETGTGKELVAQAIHDLSPRRKKNLITVNCSALSENLIENELFGHEKGAFTGAVAQKAGRFELAHGGTLFLDEIGDLTLEFQVKLLRVLQEKAFERVGGTRTIKVDIRLIAATNQDLESAIQRGTFREDLFYRLNVFPIQCTPLRGRRKDIPLLV
jgi:transcriptional regulator with GAF, ATPase, and Fis domain